MSAKSSNQNNITYDNPILSFLEKKKLLIVLNDDDAVQCWNILDNVGDNEGTLLLNLGGVCRSPLTY